MPLFLVAILLGLVQGAGEFLPISSSGHLVLAQAFLGLTAPEVAFDLALHLGTLLAVCYFYRADLWALMKELRFLPGALANPAQMRALYNGRPMFRLGLLVVLATLVTGAVGLAGKDFIEARLFSPRPVGVALLATGLVLFLAGRRPEGRLAARDITVPQALLIGLAQAVAITPGLSRSGLTICAAIFLGVSRETSARFSFILSIPAIAGAALLEIGPGLESRFGAADFMLGFAAAALCGYGALRLLVRLLRDGGLGRFAWWCWGVGLAALALTSA